MKEIIKRRIDVHNESKEKAVISLIEHRKSLIDNILNYRNKCRNKDLTFSEKKQIEYYEQDIKELLEILNDPDFEKEKENNADIETAIQKAKKHKRNIKIIDKQNINDINFVNGFRKEKITYIYYNKKHYAYIKYYNDKIIDVI